MSTLRLLILAGGSLIGLSIPVSSRLKFSRNPVISRVILGIPHPVHTFNPESRPRFALKSRIPNLISRNPVILMFFFGIRQHVHTFNPERRPPFALKSRIPSFEQRKSHIPNLISRNSVIPMFIFGIPHLVHTFNSESCYYYAIKSISRMRANKHLEEPFWDSLGTIFLDSELRYKEGSNSVEISKAK